MFPFANVIVVLKVKGRLLAKTFNWGLANRGSGMFSIACGARQNPAGKWVADDGTVLDSSDRQFLIATNSYLLKAPGSPLHKGPQVTVVGDVGFYAQNFIKYLRGAYASSPSVPAKDLRHPLSAADLRGSGPKA
jgi:hypothetical protein